MAEHDQQFEDFGTWVSRASSWLTRRGPDEHAVCFDKRGRVCSCGGDMMRARDEDTFPVRWLWPEQIGALALTSSRQEEQIGILVEGLVEIGRQIDGPAEFALATLSRYATVQDVEIQE